MALHGTEIAFRLGPGSLEEARAVAARLSAAAGGSRRRVLFVNADAGEYGWLGEWDDAAAAAGFAERPAAAAELARLEARTGKRPRVRLYAMEEG
ncbi:MAG: hypothetical protein AB7V42_14920 [Thermoleophilia bacterium]